MFAYYCGPIDGLGSNEARNVAEVGAAMAVSVVESRGGSVFLPQRAFRVGAGAVPSEVQRVNVAALEAASVVMVDLVTPARRVGVFMEMGFALARGTPVVAVLGEGSELSGHLALRWPGVTVEEFAGSWGDSWGALLDSLSGEQVRGGVLEFMFDAQAASLPEGRFGPPTRAYQGDAGWDLPVGRRTVVPPGEFVDVPLAYRLAPPPGVWYRLTGRSSTLRKYNLLVNEGIIDEGYRGPLFAGVWNLGREEVVLEAGQRVVQVIPHRVIADSLRLERVEQLRAGLRGENGFGSTGT